MLALTLFSSRGLDPEETASCLLPVGALSPFVLGLSPSLHSSVLEVRGC